MRKTNKIIMLLAAFMLLTSTIYAQVTTSGMNGRVVDTSNDPLPGATVIAIHEPSGTRYGVTTNPEGRFNIQGMRTGGPYTVEVSYIGYSKETYSDIRLLLGESFSLTAVLSEGALQLGEVMVISQRLSAFQTDRTGATTNISNQQMTAMPTINRSVSDVIRYSPFANGMSFAGGDGRSSNFTVDGANFNNNFGLSGGNLPGGGNPISIDAIEEMQVVVAPYDVRQTNFIGGGINAITKSGTNTFRGSAYTYLTDQDMRGNKIGDVDFGDRDPSSRNIYGFTLGGPIMKNKLFFFVNGEFEVQPGQVVTWRPSENGIANPEKSLSRAKISDMERVRNHLIQNYGYDPGSFTNYPADESNRKMLARLDWNINNANRLSVRYNYTMNQGWNPTNGNSTDAGFRNSSMNRISEHSMAFSNSIYSMDNVVNSFSVDLNSRFSNRFSNQFLTTYTSIKDMRGSTSDPFPFIDIMYADETGTKLEPYISAGYELFTWNNGVNNNIFNVTNNSTLYLSNHKITVGARYEFQMANNSYMRNGTGYYRYASIDDFLAQAAPRDFAVTYGYGGEKNPAAEVAFNQIGFYAQDEWTVNSNFKLSYGVRADYINYVDNIIKNNAIYNIEFGKQQVDKGTWIDYQPRRIDTGIWPEARVQFSPRVGFSWDVLGDSQLKLRGGSGIFTGRLPLVFFTNMPTNAGMVQGSYAATTTYNADGSIKASNPALALLAGPIITNVDEMISRLGLQNTITPEQGALPRDINGIDPNFKMPQVWKTSLAVDFEVPVNFPLSVTLEGIYTHHINGVMLKNYNLKQPDETWQRFNGPDDRYIYPASTELRYSNTHAYVLSNNSEGWGAIGNLTVTAQPMKNLNLMAAYTYTESKEISGMPGSNAASAYTGLIQVDGPHLPLVQRSQYVLPSRAIASASYRIPYARNHMATTLNVFYSGFSPYGNSFAYVNDMNNDGIANDLIYIPSRKGEVKFVSQADEDAFFAFVAQDKYLSKNMGKYAEAYSARAPWTHRFDVRFAQDFSINVAGKRNTLQFNMDIMNFGNLLNSEWGVNKTISQANNGRILRYEGRDAQNTPTFSMVKDSDGNYLKETYSTLYNYNQTWRLQLGVKYMF